MKSVLRDKLDGLPICSGVYIFRNAKNEPIYVGKANSLRSRVRSYFADPAVLTPKTAAMMEQARDLDYIVTHSELEALILESNLIKQYKPRYNVRIKDDKRYPWIKFTYGEDFPRLLVVRQPRRDGHKYFGPYPRSSSMRQTLKLIHSIYRVRNCKLDIHAGVMAIDRPCLEYDMKRCDAPCVGYIDKGEYRAICDQVTMLLQGRNVTGAMDTLAREIRIKMEQLSGDQRYEEAAILRDQLNAITEIQEKQSMYTPDLAEHDILGIKSFEDTAVVSVFVTRMGKLVGREKYRLDGTEDVPLAEMLEMYIEQHYNQPDLVPREIWIPVPIENQSELESMLSEMKGRKVDIIIPQIGEKHRLVEMVQQNAEFHLQQELVKVNPLLGKVPPGVFELQNILDLSKLPMRIEAYDISNISGTDAVGSMVVFKNGSPAKSDYRKFKIKTVEGSNDFAMMQEIITRRMRYLVPELSGDLPNDRSMQEIPDVVLIDGGLGQLNAAREGIHRLLSGKPIPFTIFGLAKRLEEIILPNHHTPILLPKDSKALHVLQAIRDEAHRFAITYHRQLRSKKISHSLLDEISGVGEKRKLMLLRRYGSIEKLKSVSLEELQGVPGLGQALAEQIYAFLHKS